MDRRWSPVFENIKKKFKIQSIFLLQIPYKDECQIIPKQVPNQKCIQVPKQQCSTVPVKVPRTVYKSSHQPLCGRGKYGWLMNNENQLPK